MSEGGQKMTDYIVLKIDSSNGNVEFSCEDDTGGKTGFDYDTNKIPHGVESITPKLAEGYLEVIGRNPEYWLSNVKPEKVMIYTGFSTCVWHGTRLV